ncbi:MAG: zinc metallopeptidase [bacterium]|nr:zinc metallopeptidase [bacterium]
MFFLDSHYLLLVALPSFLLALWAQMKVQGALKRYSRVPAASGLSGAGAAAEILRASGINNVTIEMTRGFLGDHYDPSSHTLRLSPDVFNGRSLAAVGIAAHEAGHALQQAQAYAPLGVRSAIVPLAAMSNLAWPVLILGLILRASPLGALLVTGALLLFLALVVMQVVNLPVEYNASRRAREALLRCGIVSAQEEGGVKTVLNAAALTYVAAALGAILQLLYFLGLARRNN